MRKFNVTRDRKLGCLYHLFWIGIIIYVIFALFYSLNFVDTEVRDILVGYYASLSLSCGRTVAGVQCRFLKVQYQVGQRSPLPMRVEPLPLRIAITRITIIVMINVGQVRTRLAWIWQ